MLDFQKIKTIPIKQRKNKMGIKDMIIPDQSSIKTNSEDIKKLAEKIIEAKKQNKQIIVMLGAHVIKVGMSLLIIDLMKQGFITHIAMNGAVPIHDFEIALIGETSEYVENTLEDGTFGMSEETGSLMNQAIIEGSKNNIGLADSIALKIENLKNKEHSILYHAKQLNIPITSHSAIGTEIIHQHPECDGAAIGQTTYKDFKTFANSISKLEDGVIINLGSAVIMPEVFLKALTIVRNLNISVKKFTAANLDMINHYRPLVNVVQRPTSLGGTFQ